MTSKQQYQAGAIAIKRANELNITLTEYFILGAIVHEACNTPNAISEKTGLERSSVSKALSRLLDKTLVFVKQDTNDKRKRLYYVK